MTDITVLQQRLSDAETALHQLLTGQKEVSVNVGGFGSVTYTTANQAALTRYIAQLKLEIHRQERGVGRRPLFVEF
jgi:flagellar biosynthesis chaperone FliJ